MPVKIDAFKREPNNVFKIILEESHWWCSTKTTVRKLFYKETGVVDYLNWYDLSTGEAVHGIREDWIKTLNWAVKHNVKSFEADQTEE